MIKDSKFTQPFEKSNQTDVLKTVSEKLIDIENNIPAGGSVIVNHEKDKQEHVGILVNKFPAIRVDSQGEFRPASVEIDSKGTFVQNKTVPYTEEVGNQTFPCGTYEITATNKLGMNVGAGGIDIRTIGNTRFITGGRKTITGTEELNATSDGNINVRAGSNITLESNTMNLRTPNQVVVDCNLGVSRNAIINGSAMIDGELFINHVTCPAEVQYTGGGIGSFAQLMPKLMIGYADCSWIATYLDILGKIVLGEALWQDGKFPMTTDIPVWTFPTDQPKMLASLTDTQSQSPEYSIYVYPHEHPFYNIPFNIKDGNVTLRSTASELNKNKLGIASNISNGYKVPASSFSHFSITVDT